MTSPTLPEFTQQDHGRSVRDVVEYSPEQVNDAWCRKIVHNVLQSLELHYATQMPHRAITPDTIVFHANGEPLLILDDIDAAPAPDSHLADDLTALARVIHYAVTQELAPAGPLDGRADGYSAALIATVDACMDPDPARRPRSVEAVRDLLGSDGPVPLDDDVTMPAVLTPAALDETIVARASGLGGSGATPVPDLPASAMPPAFTTPVERVMPDAVADAHRGGTRRGQRWAIAAGGAVIALALVSFAAFHDTASQDPIVPALTQAGNGVPSGLPAPGSAAAVGTAAMDARTEQAPASAAVDPTGATATVTAQDPAGGKAKKVAGSLTANPASNLAGSAASGASSGGTTRSGGGVDQPDGMTRVAPDPVSAAATAPPVVTARAAAAPEHGEGATDPREAVPPSAVSGHASYQLQIKPWGNVYVDGVDHGVSPPLKRLTLTPGRHTVRITNPKYRDSLLEFDSAQTTSNGKIIVDFNHEAQ